MKQQGTQPALRLTDLLRILSRRWQIITLSTVFCALLGLALGMAAPKTYTATASLTVSPITINPFSSAAVNQQINITTERAILSSGEVAAIAAKELGEKVSPGVLQANAEAAAPSGSQILEVSVTLPDATKAAEQANALAKAYLQFRSQGAAEVAAGYIKQLDARIDGLNRLLILSESQTQQLQDLIQQRTSLTLASASPGRIIGYASAPSKQSSMGWLVFMTAGTAGGLLVGLALALFRDRTDPKVRTAARMAGHFDRDLVLLHDDDQESVRWLVRTVRQTGTRDLLQQTIFVGIIALHGSGPVGLCPWLAGLTRAHKLDAVAVRGGEVSAEAVDLGWPARAASGKWKNHDVVYVEIDDRLSGTRLADVSDRMDILFIAAGKDTDLGRVRTTLALTTGMPTDRLTPIFYTPTSRRKNGRRRGRTPAVVPAGDTLGMANTPSRGHTAQKHSFMVTNAPPAQKSPSRPAPQEGPLHDAPTKGSTVLVPHGIKKEDRD